MAREKRRKSMTPVSETEESPASRRPIKRRKANPQDAMQESNSFSAAGPSGTQQTVNLRPRPRMKHPILLIKHRTTLDDSSTGGAIKQVAYLIGRLQPIEKLFTLFSTGCVLDNLAGHGILTRELMLKTRDEMIWPIFYTVDEQLDAMLLPQAALYSHRARTLGSFPLNCACMPPGRLAFPGNKFDAVVTITAPDHFYKPAAKANVAEVLRVLKPDGVAIFGNLWCLSYCRRNPDDSIAVHNKPRLGDTHKNLLRRVGMHPHQLMHQIVKAAGAENVQLVAMQERTVFFRARTAQDLYTMLWNQLGPLLEKFTEEERMVMSGAISGIIQEQAVIDPMGWTGFGLPMPVSIVLVQRVDIEEGAPRGHQGMEIPGRALLSRR